MWFQNYNEKNKSRFICQFWPSDQQSNGTDQNDGNACWRGRRDPRSRAPRHSYCTGELCNTFSTWSTARPGISETILKFDKFQEVFLNEYFQRSVLISPELIEKKDDFPNYPQKSIFRHLQSCELNSLLSRKTGRIQI